jgi:diguanylate cyclase (GGDEF)-like protein
VSAGRAPDRDRRLRDADSAVEEALWRLLDASGRDDDARLLAELGAAEAALAATDHPYGAAWRHAVAARRAVRDDDAAGVGEQVGAAREALEKCPAAPATALLMAYLAAVAAAADHPDAAMLLAVDASLLTEPAAAPAGTEPSRELHEAHLWLSLTLSALDLEELAVAHAVRARRVAEQLGGPRERWRSLLLCARQHTELAQTLQRRGETGRAHELAGTAIGCAEDARALPVEPADADRDLLDVVHGWAMTCRDELDDALGPLRRVARSVARHGGLRSRGYADLALARLLARLGARDGDAAQAEEALTLLTGAAGEFAAAGDRRRYRQCLLELGRATADLGRPAEALHWLEAYRADTGRAQARGRELWAEMFVRRSRLREAERQADLLRRHALEDPLTGLGNRRSAERRLAALRPADQPVSLAVVDVDRFKEVNDDASHTSGDAVLRRVADLLLEHSRTGDEVYRWAGDEFLVVLPAAGEAQAVGVMERLRAAVAGADWDDLRVPGPVTVSIGVATAAQVAPAGPDAGGAGGDAAAWRALFDTADLHLFSAKRGGRNRVRGHGPHPPGPGGDASPEPPDAA